jgi:hypothetical protein
LKENNKNRVSKSKEHEKETSREGIKNKKTNNLEETSSQIDT